VRVGHVVPCDWPGAGPQRLAEVIEARRLPSGREEYYMHYLGQDRRLDRWVTPDAFDAARAVDKQDHLRAAARGGSLFDGAAGGAAATAAKSSLSSTSSSSSSSSSASNLPLASSSASSSGPASSAAGTADGTRKVTRTHKRRQDAQHNRPSELSATHAAREEEHRASTRVKNVNTVHLGRFEMDTWYFSPYPEEFSAQDLYICEHCLKYVKKPSTLDRHMLKCTLRCPPGNEVYRSGTLSLFEVDGRNAKMYAQNLCLLAKLFLDHKTLFFDVEPFLFYVLCEATARGMTLVGYFSKEKRGANLLACILTLPPFQRRGYGKMLIALAYGIARRESRVGSPERPLSDLGLVSFRSYWTAAILDVLRHRDSVSLSIRDIEARTGIASDDIVGTLQSLGLVRYHKGQYVIHVTPRLIDEHVGKSTRGPVVIDEAALHYVPHPAMNMGRS
jgi:histone acetyltransferase MYST1